ncbi:sigma-70 family RNA polymerase sigma factor [Pseudomaricurvus sp. HS19]|uniref:sigma-70 family RNA polymerase sigma factor n=1 Tax=Pseudomaricurvus sp. HS19 TaxID=2692626 RepID=UPI00136BAAC8|nr:sigma-70 family RNA polymerase sigma factor [Pseudomaricurvus sp. HS19]MYM64345.1 sigma-70 family RNA polymerase sigma factor [Pseudomaricurvus sp. HS19]
MSQEEITAIDWPSLIFAPAFMSSLDAMAARRFVQPVLAEEAVTAMIEALSADNWQKLSHFSGNSQPSTFAYAVASRAMEDFARKRFGRPRPPAWLQALGNAWVRLWQMLCLERQWPELIRQKLAEEFQPGLLEQAMRTIKQRIPRCGEPGFSECCVTELGLETLPDDSGHSLDVSLDQARQQTLLALLGQLLSDNPGNHSACPSDAEVIAEWRRALDLDSEDRLLLRLTYEDGLSSRKIASLLGTSAGSVQRRLQRVRDQLAGLLAGAGDETPSTEVEYP